MNSARCESLCIHLSGEDIETLSVDAECHGAGLLVYRRLASWDTGTLHLGPLGAYSKDRDSTHSRKVGMTISATRASLPLCIFHLTSQHCRLLYIPGFSLPIIQPPHPTLPRQSNLKYQKNNNKFFSTLSFSAEAKRPQSLGENHKSKGGTDAVSALQLEIGTLQ